MNVPTKPLTPATVALRILRCHELAAKRAAKAGDQVGARRLAVATARDLTAAGPDVLAKGRQIVANGRKAGAVFADWIDTTADELGIDR
jgi:hypothetical protein